MKRILFAAVAAAIGASALAVAAPASAAIVCNANGDCWHTDHKQTYDRNMHIVRHNDDWYFHQKWEADKTRHWRESHDGRGYYRNGVWVAR